MRTRELGSTGIHVNEIGYGAMQLSINRDLRPSENDAVHLLERIIDDLGVNFIDTADAYCLDDTETGHNERLIARALQGQRRDRVIVATKGGFVRPGGAWAPDGRPEHLQAACEASLRALGTDRIDLYQLHRPDPDVPLVESLGAIVDLQRDGKVRFIGVSNFTVDQLREAMGVTRITSIQNRLSVADQEEDEELIRLCEEADVTYIPWYPLGGRMAAAAIDGNVSGLQQVAARHAVTPHAMALAWLLARSRVMLPIPGTRSFEHMADNVTASSIALRNEDLRELAAT